MMNTEQLRLFLLGALLLVAFSLWNAWQMDYPTKPVENLTAANSPISSEKNPNTTPAATIGTNNVAEKYVFSGDRFIKVKTDVLEVLIDKIGGNIINVNLLGYPAKINSPYVPFSLLSDAPDNFYIAQSHLVEKKDSDVKQQTVYTSDQDNYVLTPDQQELKVDLKWKNFQGLSIIKSFTFKRNNYLMDIGFQVNNATTTPWHGYLYAELDRKDVPADKKGFFQINPYVGGAISSPEKRYEKISFQNMSEKELDKNIQNGWGAFLQHYFLSAWIPNPDQMYHYTTKVWPKNIYAIGLAGPLLTAEPNQKIETSIKLYTGPAIADLLKNIAPGLDLTVDYGVLWFIGVLIFGVMKEINKVVGNWGWSIVLVTVFIKLLFYKLSAASYKSMAAMRRLQPKLLALKDRYGDDRQKLSQATMELYKSEKINPLGGCLPIVVQIPVFIALYWVLLESVQLRQAPFILWIHDLSVQDPYYVLPILMGISIFIQQKLNPPPADPVQAKVMMILPVIFTGLFVSFPAGLVLYWVVNNVLSIAQQWYITRKFS